MGRSEIGLFQVMSDQIGSVSAKSKELTIFVNRSITLVRLIVIVNPSNHSGNLYALNLAVEQRKA